MITEQDIVDYNRQMGRRREPLPHVRSGARDERAPDGTPAKHGATVPGQAPEIPYRALALILLHILSQNTRISLHIVCRMLP